MAPGGSHRVHRVGDRHLRLFNVLLQHIRVKMLIVENTGHFDDEIDFAGSQGLDRMKVDTIKPQKTVSFLP